MTCPDALPFLDLEDSDFAPLESKRPPRPSRRVRRTFTSQFIVGLPSAISEWIPMEVIEVMLNYLGDLPNCNATLASCSLVCKAWHSISRYLLFRNVTVVVGQTNIDLSIPPSYDRNHFRIEWPQLSNIVLSRPSNFNPSFSATRYIQKICWTGGSFPFLLVDISEDIHDFFSIAKDLTSLRSIALFHKVYHAEAATTQAQLTATLKHLDFRSMMDHISNLEINDCDFRCTAQVYILVAALRRLERLVIYSTGRRDPAPAKPSDLSAPPTLHALGFWYCNFTIDALRWITSTPNCYITNLSVGRTSRTSEVSECLALMGGSLLRLCVGTKGLNLSKNINLRHLELTGLDLIVQSFTPTILNDALQSITSNSLETLIIDLKINQQISNLDRLDWPTLLKIFNEPRFQRLQKLTFAVSNMVPHARIYLSRKLVKFGGRLDAIAWSMPEGVSQVNAE